MSCKVPINNGINVNELQWTKNGSLDTNVKLAGEEAKDRLYEPKHKKKLVRVLTVIAYVFFVSLAAIMLSLYYVFLWNGDKKILPKYSVFKTPESHRCDNIIAEMQQQITSYNSDDFPTTDTTTITSIEENVTSLSDDDGLGFEMDDLNQNTFMKRLMYLKK